MLDYSNVSFIKCTGYSSDFKIGASVKNMNKIFRHVMLSDILKLKREWGEKCGDPIICCDSRNYWRKDIFPYYKGLRKKHREDSDTDWKSIFPIMSDFKQELIETFPYKVLEIENAEDLPKIAALTMVASSLMNYDEFIMKR